MAIFPNLTPTYNGDKLLTQAVNGHTLTFTRGAYGAGTLADSDDIRDFTALKDERMSLPITDKKVADNGTSITLIFNVSNSTLEKGFNNRELGIFAKLDDGDEVLFAYSNAGNNYDSIPDKNTPTDENTFEVQVFVTDEANVSVSIDGSIVYLTKAQVEEKISEHDSNANAHDGILEKITDLGDDIVKKMALTTVISIISALTTDSWFGQLLKLVLTASGVRFLAAQNGYLCLGSFFGNIIIQWLSTGKSQEYITFPIAFTAADTATLLVTPYHSDGATHPTDGWSVSMTSASTAHCSLTGYDLRVIAIGW
nr:MAG TPA: tail collar fiber protein [Caudoviricetes sp.]